MDSASLGFIAGLVVLNNLVWWLMVRPLQTTLDAYRQSESEHRMEMRAMLARLSVPVPVQAPSNSPRPEPKGRWVEDPEGFENIFIPEEG